MPPARPLLTRLVALLAGLLLLGPLAAAPAQAAPGGEAGQAKRYAATAHAATNAQRVSAGLPALRQDACLRRAATRQATVMATAGVMSHQDLGAVLAACGLRSAGENVAMGFTSGRSVVRGWLASPGHRANILQPAYRLEGIGAVRDTQGRWWVAQVFGTRA